MILELFKPSTKKYPWPQPQWASPEKQTLLKFANSTPKSWTERTTPLQDFYNVTAAWVKSLTQKTRTRSSTALFVFRLSISSAIKEDWHMHTLMIWQISSVRDADFWSIITRLKRTLSYSSVLSVLKNLGYLSSLIGIVNLSIRMFLVKLSLSAGLMWAAFFGTFGWSSSMNGALKSVKTCEYSYKRTNASTVNLTR